MEDNDEEEADKKNAAREPRNRRGASLGSRDKKDAKPLMRIDELTPGLRTDEMIGAEVRSSDDKIVGEVPQMTGLQLAETIRKKMAAITDAPTVGL